MDTLTLNGELFSKMLCSGTALLKKNIVSVNELNVFPVPDGDTGDNMYLTVASGAAAVKSVSDNIGNVSKEAAHKMLESARGNSGVILSQIFSGLADGLAMSDNVTAPAFAYAMQKGVDKAYAAVQTPVEGTILTVLREGVSGADCSGSLNLYFDSLVLKMRESLKHTPELLPVLKEAGVIDSGGAGLVYIFEGMAKALTGETLNPEFVKEEPDTPVKSVDLSLFTKDTELKFGYCTEFLLRLQSKKLLAMGTDINSLNLNPIKEQLEKEGNSIVFLKDDSIIKVHIHTFCPGNVLNYMQSFGEFLTVKIENMMLQHEEVIKDSSESTEALCTHRTAKKKYGTVCVAPGEGLKEKFLELGVDAVVDGGQSMNPSSGDFLRAFKSINAENILVFPGNGNIVLAAEQAGKLYSDACVTVIKADTLGKTYAALSCLDLSKKSTEEIVSSMSSAMEESETAMISTASRDSFSDGIEIHEGDILGFTKKTILTANKTRDEALFSLTEKLNAKDYGLLLLFSGENIPESELNEVTVKLSEKYRYLEIIPVCGKQPVYDYILILQ